MMAMFVIGREQTLGLDTAKGPAEFTHQVSNASTQAKLRCGSLGTFEGLLDAAEAPLKACQIIAAPHVAVEPICLVLEHAE